MTIFRYTLIRSFGNKTNLLFLTLFPVICIFLPQGELWPPLPYGYQYFGIVMLFVGIRLATLIIEDRVNGVVKRLAIAPISYLHYLSGHLLAYAVIMVLQCVIVVYGGVAIGRELAQPDWLLLLYVSYSFVALAIALAWVSIFRSKDTAFLVYMSLIFFMSILGGLIIPLEMFPDLLKRLAVLMPTYWLERGLDWLVYGERMADYWIVQGVLWLYTILFVTIGSFKKLY